MRVPVDGNHSGSALGNTFYSEPQNKDLQPKLEVNNESSEGVGIELSKDDNEIQLGC